MSLLGIDIGTTMCKAAVFAVDGRCLAIARREHRVLHPQPGWAELDSLKVWDAVQQMIREVAAAAQHDPITAVCAGSLGEAFVPVTADRSHVGRSIICSADSRGQEYVDRLREAYDIERFYRVNPNRPGPQYSLPKMLWLRDHEPRVFDAADHFLLWGDFIGFMLGAEPFASQSLANRTLLLDWTKGDWSGELLAYAELDRRRLGRVVPAGTVVGTVEREIGRSLGLGPNVKIVAGGHDQCCNSLGCGCIRPGEAVCGIGTFECITPAYLRPADPMGMLAQHLSIEHHLLPGLFVSFLFNQAGSLVKWFSRTFAADLADDRRTDVYRRLDRELPDEPTRLLVLPHFEPPLWPEHLRETSGVIMGLTTDSRRGDVLKAIMECTTMYFVDGLQSLRGMGIDLSRIIATGGGARSDAWLRIKADVFGIPIVRPRISEGGLTGAAMLAGLATGQLDSPRQAVGLFVQEDRCFEPNPTRHAQYMEKLAVYRRMASSLSPLLRDVHRLWESDDPCGE